MEYAVMLDYLVVNLQRPLVAIVTPNALRARTCQK
jgi:hypothetical protein